MLDIAIIALQLMRIVFLVIGFSVAVLMVLIITTDFRWYSEFVTISFPRRRVGRHRRTIAIAIASYRNAKAQTENVENDEKAMLRKEKEESARGSFFDEFYAPGFDSTGGLIYHNGIKFPTELSKKYYRKLDELADNKIYENTEVL